MQIGEVAERVGLSLRTVRYYEEVGLVTPVDRTPGGFRVYDEGAITRLTLARDLKPLGFSLEEIREIVDLVVADSEHADGARVGEFVARAREEHKRARRSLQAAERIIEVLEGLATEASQGPPE